LKRIKTPLTDEAVSGLKVGDLVDISGVLYSARDATHLLMIEALDRGEDLPVDLKGQVIYYMGPTPARPGRVLGAAGPTTASRMDSYTPRLLEEGLKGMIGKGRRSQEVVRAIKEHHAIYFATIGGAGALLSKRIRKAEVVAYPDLGPEALLRLEVERFPAIVAIDPEGRDIYSLKPR
jgi:fumarate hydratase subunit beta